MTPLRLFLLLVILISSGFVAINSVQAANYPSQGSVNSAMSNTQPASNQSYSIGGNYPETVMRVYSPTPRQLPKTGPPIAVLALVGLLPIGLKFRRYGKEI